VDAVTLVRGGLAKDRIRAEKKADTGEKNRGKENPFHGSSFSIKVVYRRVRRPQSQRGS
jgi:hypothetical protein